MAGLTIGKLAAVAGVGVETVRFYERMGLIERPVRPTTGYRTYSRKSVSQIAFVRQAQELGFTLREIRDLLELRANPSADCAAVRARTMAKLAQLETRINRFERMRAALRELLSGCPGRGELNQCPIVGALSAPAGTARPARPRVRSQRRSAMRNAELVIQGMHCDGCAKTVEALLAAEPGVKMASASYAGGAARVIFDPAMVELPALIQAVERAGFRARERG